MARNDITRKGKHLAFLLRHDKEAFEDGSIDKHGWRQVSELAELGYNHSLLDEIVSTNNKQRYEYSVDRRKIRARQGHSIPVDVVLKETTSLDILCHGITTMILRTAYYLASGTPYTSLQKKETAVNVGFRHGKPLVIKIDCYKLLADSDTL